MPVQNLKVMKANGGGFNSSVCPFYLVASGLDVKMHHSLTPLSLKN